MINQFWTERVGEKPEDPVPFSLLESDKQLIRDNIIEAIIHSIETIRWDISNNILKSLSIMFYFRAQLIVCVRKICTEDFPTKWCGIIDKIHQFILTDNINSWYGALQAYYQLCKIYE